MLFSLACASLTRSSLACFTLTRSQFGTLQFDAMPVWCVSPFCAYIRTVGAIFEGVFRCLVHDFLNLISMSCILLSPTFKPATSPSSVTRTTAELQRTTCAKLRFRRRFSSFLPTALLLCLMFLKHRMKN